MAGIFSMRSSIGAPHGDYLGKSWRHLEERKYQNQIVYHFSTKSWVDFPFVLLEKNVWESQSPNITWGKNEEKKMKNFRWLMWWFQSSNIQDFICWEKNSSVGAFLLQIATERQIGTFIKVESTFCERRSRTSFMLREKHFNSSSELLCVSLLNHKDGTRTIEMILVSTVLFKISLPTLYISRWSRNTCGCMN